MKKFTILVILFFSLQIYASNLRVINGDVVSSTNEKYKSIVALIDSNTNNVFCGGTLISPTWILTAAHCLEGTTKSNTKILLNTYDATNLTNVISVKRLVSHPSFNSYNLENDIGLIELSSSASSELPIALNTQGGLDAGESAWVAGWGNMSISGQNFPNNLRDALVPIIDLDECNGVNSYNGELNTNHICAGYMSGDKDSCQGDSGGPLIIQNNGEYQLAGIVSFGGSNTQDCAAPNFPGIYTKVQNYTSWINQYVDNFKTANTDQDESSNDDSKLPDTNQDESSNDNSSTEETNSNQEINDIKVSLEITDIENFNFNEWYLSGTTAQITDLSIFDNVQIIFIYQDNKFKAYAPDITTRQTLQDKGYEILTYIPANSGIWIKK